MRDLPNKHVLNRPHLKFHQFQAFIRRHQEYRTKFFYQEAQVPVEVAGEKPAVQISIKCAFPIESQHNSSF